MKKYTVLSLLTVLSSLQLAAQSKTFNYQTCVRNSSSELIVNKDFHF